MERWFKWTFDSITLVCVVITTIFTYLIWTGPEPTTAKAISTVSGAPPWWLVVIGLLAIALLLTRWIPVLYRLGGVKFFPDRATLRRELGPLAEQLSAVSNVSALWVVGQQLYMAGAKTDSIKRLLLPNPNNESFKHHVRTGPHESAGQMVKEITALASKTGTKVRWYDPFIFHSIILADVDKSTGWMHIESVFPYSRSEYRPSYTLYKKHSPDAITEMQRIFDELWEQAKIPTAGDLSK